MILVAITGTPGSGKGTITDFLIHKKGFVHYSASAFIVKEIKKRGMLVNRDSMNIVGNDLRQKHSASYIIEQLYKEAESNNKDAVIEAIRTVGEAEFLKKKGALLIGIDAAQNKRFERITARKSEKDSVSFKEFVELEEKENFSTDPSKQNVKNVLQKADIHLVNNGTVEELEQALESELTQRGLLS